MTRFNALPFFFLNVDVTHEDSLYKDWPPLPGPARWVITHVMAIPHRGYWKFASCDGYGRPKPLYAPGPGRISRQSWYSWGFNLLWTWTARMEYWLAGHRTLCEYGKIVFLLPSTRPAFYSTHATNFMRTLEATHLCSHSFRFCDPSHMEAIYVLLDSSCYRSLRKSGYKLWSMSGSIVLANMQKRAENLYKHSQ